MIVLHAREGFWIVSALNQSRSQGLRNAGSGNDIGSRQVCFLRGGGGGEHEM